MSSNESNFFVQGQRSQHVRRSREEKHREAYVDQSVKHPQENVWGMFQLLRCQKHASSQRHDAITIVHRSYSEESGSTARKTFTDGTGIFQQDLTPCHTSKRVKKFMNMKMIEVPEWPGNSPDLNSIEDLWSVCKQGLRGIDCTTKEKLVQALIEVWYRDSKIASDCSELVDSMQTRVKMPLKNRGHIPY